ncbi:MAG: hypothetical protein WDM80_03235 [Limisphaerales bacterium]
MKRTALIIVSLALVTGGFWLGRAAWRAHKNIVTLNVRNMPLKDVIGKIEWQTWEKIQVDKHLDGNVTLQLKNVPLAEALDRVAEEAGARAQTLYAVHRSDYALKRLQTALQSGDRIDAGGWTNLAPHSAGTGLLDGLKPDDVRSQGQAHPPASEDVQKAIQQQLTAQAGAMVEALKKAAASGTNYAGTHKVRMMTMTLGPDGKLRQSEGGELSPELQAAMANALQKGSTGRVVMSSPVVSMTKTGPAGTLEEVEPEILSPERIVIEIALDEQFTNDLPTQPTRTAAEQAARKVKGHCTTLYALEKSDLPAGISRALRGLTGETLLSGSNGMSPNPTALADRLAQAMRREKAEQYEKLTPEQRAQKARSDSSSSNQ